MNEYESTNPATGQPAPESAAQTWETTKEKAGEALKTGQRYVSDNPIPSVLSVFGLGFLLGLLVGWSIAHQEEDDYRTIARKLAKEWKHKLHLR